MSETKDYPPYLDYPKPKKKQTNADRIRSMTDEELVYFLTSIEIGSNPERIVINANTDEEEWRWKHWLEREAVEWEF